MAKRVTSVKETVSGSQQANLRTTSLKETVSGSQQANLRTTSLKETVAGSQAGNLRVTTLKETVAGSQAGNLRVTSFKTTVWVLNAQQLELAFSDGTIEQYALALATTTQNLELAFSDSSIEQYAILLSDVTAQSLELAFSDSSIEQYAITPSNVSAQNLELAFSDSSIEQYAVTLTKKQNGAGLYLGGTVGGTDGTLMSTGDDSNPADTGVLVWGNTSSPIAVMARANSTYQMIPGSVVDIVSIPPGTETRWRLRFGNSGPWGAWGAGLTLPSIPDTNTLIQAEGRALLVDPVGSDFRAKLRWTGQLEAT